MSYYREILQIGLPALAENGLQMLMTAIDAYLVAQLGLAAVSGVSVAGNILAVYQAIFIALAAAVSTQTAARLAAGSSRPAIIQETARQAVQLTVCLGLFMGLGAVFGGRWLLTLLGTEDQVSRLGGIYLAWVGGGILLLGLMTSLGAVLRASHQPRRPMYVSLLVNLLNALLSALAIFVLNLGVLGAALGTVLARAIGVAILWHDLRLPLAFWAGSWDRELVRLALPSAGERLIMRGGDVLVVGLIISLGTQAVAGNAIGETLIQFVYLPPMSLAAATVILSARARSRQDFASLDRIRKESYRLSLAAMLLISGGLLLAGPSLLTLFTADDQVLAAGQLVIWASFIGTPMAAGTLVYTALWQGLGQPERPFYATSLGMGLIRIGLGAFIIYSLKLGLAGLLAAVILDNLFRWLFLRVSYHQRYGRILKHENQ